MPNYILSRTSPPAHIYERKINLGYGVKVDVSDATTEPNKGKKMNDAKQVLDVADQPVPVTDAQPLNGQVAVDGDDASEITSLDGAVRGRDILKAQAAEEAKAND